MTDIQLDREAIALFQQYFAIPESERSQWVAAQTSGRPELKARVDALIDADRSIGLETGGALHAFSDEDVPERIGAYRIIERIGRGGMGSVYRGERDIGDFQHVAAIKIIRPGPLSDVLIERFRHERQVLAGLSHPNIAQLYDGGELPGGEPYIIMEYVDGSAIHDWIEKHRPPPAERQRLFQEICSAVSFAHANLVVHRDLTPSNVLVTQEGRAKLIDFGIAKPASADECAAAGAPTSINSLSLTPGYAAPERMISTNVTTAADIFSLGKIFERIMPHKETDAELRAIIARATHAEPSLRYSTVQALSDDVRAWIEGYPVSAMGRGQRYLTAKFITRHRSGVIAAFAGLGLMVGALMVTLIANQRAQQARAEAEQRFDQTRSIAKALLFDAFDEVSRTAGSTKARELLARTGLSYVNSLAADPRAPVDVRIEAGLGYVRLAEVVGGGQAGQMGKMADANELLAKAEAILRPMSAGLPKSPAIDEALATMLIEQSGTNLYNNGKTLLARKQAIEAQTLLAPLATISPDQASKYMLAVQSEADSHGWMEDYAAALPVHQRVERFFSTLPVAMQQDLEVRSARSGNLRLLGEAHHRLMHTADARRTLDLAVAINEQLRRAAPDDPQVLRKLAISLWYRAVVHRTNDRDALALASIDRAVELAEQLRIRDPNDAGGLQLFALTSEVKAQVLGDVGRFAESFSMVDAVIAAHERMVTLAGDAAGAKRSMSAALSTGGGNFYNGGNYVRACASWQRAIAILMELDRKGSLTDYDRKNSMVEIRRYLEQACMNGPPRQGLGLRI